MMDLPDRIFSREKCHKSNPADPSANIDTEAPYYITVFSEKDDYVKCSCVKPKIVAVVWSIIFILVAVIIFIIAIIRKSNALVVSKWLYIIPAILVILTPLMLAKGFYWEPRQSGIRFDARKRGTEGLSATHKSLDATGEGITYQNQQFLNKMGPGGSSAVNINPGAGSMMAMGLMAGLGSSIGTSVGSKFIKK